MTRYSLQPRGRISLKGYEFFLLLKIWVKILVKNISKNLSGKYGQKLLNHAKQSTTYSIKTASKKAIQKTAEATDV